MTNSPIRNNKLLQEAYEAGYNRALNEEQPNIPRPNMAFTSADANRQQPKFNTARAGVPIGIPPLFTWSVDENGQPIWAEDEGESRSNYAERWRKWKETSG